MTKTLNKAFTYLKNKFYLISSNYEIKVKSPGKLKDGVSFNDLLANSKDENLILDFATGFKLSCSFRDLHVVAETCITEDYQKLPEVKINPGDVVFDIGAHIGSFSIYAASKGARVYSFEPDINNFKKLQNNIALNGFEDKVTAFNHGVFGQTTKLHFDTSSHNSGGHSVLTHHNNDTIEVEVKKLSEILNQLGVNQIDLMKIDIEGAEYDIFKNFDAKEISAVNRIVGEYHIVPEYAGYDFNYIKEVLSPNYSCKKYPPYNFIAIKK